MTKCAKCRKEIEPGKEVRKGFLWKNAECAPKSYRSEFRSPIILGDYVNQKTLADVIDLLLARKSAFDVDTTVKLMVSSEMGSLEVKGKIRYVPSEEEK